MRLIDADALKEHIEVITYEGMWHESEVDEFVSVENIDSAPSIDIVRCKECKYAEVSVSPITGLWCTRFGINDMAMEADDFCSYGEREGE